MRPGYRQSAAIRAASRTPWSHPGVRGRCAHARVEEVGADAGLLQVAAQKPGLTDMEKRLQVPPGIPGHDAPRRLVEITARGRPVEMKRSRRESFCCGGGGGMSFVEEPADKRVNLERAREAVETGADVVAVGCPFCMTMLEDGVAAQRGGRDVKVLDVSELLWQSSQPQERVMSNE